MTLTSQAGDGGEAGAADLTYDPYDVAINADPYPTYRRLRDEAPLYYNAEYDFYALSRYDDVEASLKDWRRFSSAKGGILEIIKADIEMPPGVFIFEDPPIHTMHRGLVSRVFTPKKMAALEDKVRQFCAACLDPLVGEERIDFVRDLGAEMPMRVIGMLVGIPDAEQPAVRAHTDANLRTEPGQPMEVDDDHFLSGDDMFGDYIDWRAKNPSDDLMTELINAEFEDESGTTRTLTRDELMIFIQVIAGAGNETTTKLIGWTGKVLSENPDQRRELAADRSLIPNAIEELLRYEPPGPHIGRFTTEDVEVAGGTIPAGNAVLLVAASANRDERRWENAESFDIHRQIGQHLTFGYGLHFCLGAALARLEGRIALDEVLKRFPDWTVDLDNAKLASTSTVRGWETMPAVIG
ncbi:MAG TPA: cytochrome P450 [Acidimicrobiales bacterium]